MVCWAVRWGPASWRELASLAWTGRLRHKLEEDESAYADGPDLSFLLGCPHRLGLPESRFMHRGWAGPTPPAKVKPRAIVLSLYGKGSQPVRCFRQLAFARCCCLGWCAAGHRLSRRGRDNYWHKRANGTDAHAMLVDEFVPLLIGRLGALPFALHGYSMGGYGALLAAERGVRPTGDSFFKGSRLPARRFGPSPGKPRLERSTAPRTSTQTTCSRAWRRWRSLSVRLDCGTLDPFSSSHTPALGADDLAALSSVPPMGDSHQRLLAFGGTGPNAVPRHCLRRALKEG